MDKDKADEAQRAEKAEKDYMYQQGKEIRLKLELEGYFEISEIQADYDEFVRHLIPESIRGVLFLFAFLLENFRREQAPWSPADLLFDT